MEILKKYEIWREGMRATGEELTAHCHGSTLAHSFLEACKKILPFPFDEENMTAYGMRLFDNEEDARREFG